MTDLILIVAHYGSERRIHVISADPRLVQHAGSARSQLDRAMQDLCEEPLADWFSCTAHTSRTSVTDHLWRELAAVLNRQIAHDQTQQPDEHLTHRPKCVIYGV